MSQTDVQQTALTESKKIEEQLIPLREQIKILTIRRQKIRYLASTIETTKDSEQKQKAIKEFNEMCPQE